MREMRGERGMLYRGSMCVAGVEQNSARSDLLASTFVCFLDCISLSCIVGYIGIFKTHACLYILILLSVLYTTVSGEIKMNFILGNTCMISIVLVKFKNDIKYSTNDFLF